METKIFLSNDLRMYKYFLLGFLLLISNYSLAQEDLRFAQQKTSTVDGLEYGLSNPDPIIFFESTVIRKSDLKEEVEEVNELGDFIFELNPTKLNLIQDISNKNRNLKVVQSIDGSYKISDGSIIIKFDQIPDFNMFANEYNIIFTYDLSDINRGVFMVNDFLEIEKIIAILRSDKRILEVTLNLLDPSIRAQ